MRVLFLLAQNTPGGEQIFDKLENAPMIRKYRQSALPLLKCITNPVKSLITCDKESIAFQQDMLTDKRLAQTMNGLQAEFYASVPGLEAEYRKEIAFAKCKQLGVKSPLNPGVDGHQVGDPTW